MVKQVNDVYIQNGYTNRRDYLEHLAEDYSIDIATVIELAQLLGPNEDFDGLVTTLEDEADRRNF